MLTQDTHYLLSKNVHFNGNDTRVLSCNVNARNVNPNINDNFYYRH